VLPRTSLDVAADRERAAFEAKLVNAARRQTDLTMLTALRSKWKALADDNATGVGMEVPTCDYHTFMHATETRLSDEKDDMLRRFTVATAQLKIATRSGHTSKIAHYQGAVDSIKASSLVLNQDLALFRYYRSELYKTPHYLQLQHWLDEKYTAIGDGATNWKDCVRGATLVEKKLLQDDALVSFEDLLAEEKARESENRNLLAEEEASLSAEERNDRERAESPSL